MTTETETKIVEDQERNKTSTEKFAEWLMRRAEKKAEKESNLEGLMKLNVFLSVCILVAVAGQATTNYLLMAWTWF